MFSDDELYKDYLETTKHEGAPSLAGIDGYDPLTEEEEDCLVAEALREYEYLQRIAEFKAANDRAKARLKDLT